MSVDLTTASNRNFTYALFYTQNTFLKEIWKMNFTLSYGFKMAGQRRINLCSSR